MAGKIKLHGKDIAAYEDIDIDALLGTLTEEEIEELGTELIDPDDSCIPPAERCRYRTDKAPTGPYNRRALLDFIEKKAKEEKDWDEPKPYKKETRGNVWKAKAEERIQINDDIEMDTEWDEVLASATEEELVDLAAILGFHGMLNQVQYHQAFVENREILGGGGFQGVAKPENLKLFEDNAPNQTNVDEALKQIKADDPKLKELNLNNIKNISLDRLIEFGKALGANTHLERFHLCNTKATDKVAKAIAKSLETNKTLIELNMESNYISGATVIEVLEAIAVNKIVTELRIANQRPAVLGSKVEMRIAELIKENIKLLKFGIFLQTPARVVVHQYMKRNNDNLRRGRTGEDLLEPPKPKAPFVSSKKASATKLSAPDAAEEKKPEPEPKEEEDESESEEEDETESSEEE